MSARPMSERFAALVKIANEIGTPMWQREAPAEPAREDVDKLLVALLDFAEEHVMVARQFADGTMVEALVPFASPLRDIDSATGRPSWAVVPSSLVRALQRAIPLLVRLGDHQGDKEGRGETLLMAHDALGAIGADVSNGYPIDNRPGASELAELIAATSVKIICPGAIERIKEALARYEAAGAHNHGRGPMKPGASCPGREHDCWVYKARVLLDRARQASCAGCRDQANGVILACPTHPQGVRS